MGRRVREGQVWASNDGKRTYVIERCDDLWEDCTVRNRDTGTRSDIFASNLRRNYTLVSESAPEATS